jgi:DNA invertase Pin-like site-specific DNA recombinase
MGFKGSMRLPGWESTQGSNHRRAKIDEDAVRDMRSGKQTREELAKKYGISAGTVRNIQQRRCWKHVQ